MNIQKAINTTILIIFLSAFGIGQASSTIITIEFEPGQLTSSGAVIGIPSYSEDGFTFTPQNNVFGNAAPSPLTNSTLTQNGTGYLFYTGPSDGDGNSVTMTSNNGSLFSLLSFDAAEAFTNINAGAQLLYVRGDKVGGGSVNFGYGLDQIKDGLGGANDFENIVLPGTFTDLVSVTFLADDINLGNVARNTSSFALDNIRLDVTEVPEPLAIILMVIGLTGIGISRRRQVQ